MCLYLGKENPTVLIAKENITCYKVLRVIRGSLESPHIFGYYWELGKTHEVKLPLAKDGRRKDRDEINKGLHSFSDQFKAQVNLQFHLDSKVFEAVIPKGSHYYVNSCNTEYASSKLKIIKQL